MEMEDIQHIEEKDEVLVKNAIRWVSKRKDIPVSKLFIQWLIRYPATGFKAMIKQSGTERYFEVTYLGNASGYDIATYERKDLMHGT